MEYRNSQWIIALTLSSLVWARTRRVASALPATSGTTTDAEEAGVDDDDSPWALVADAATAAAADTATGPEEVRAHVATAEARRVRAFIFARENERDARSLPKRKEELWRFVMMR